MFTENALDSCFAGLFSCLVVGRMTLNISSILKPENYLLDCRQHDAIENAAAKAISAAVNQSRLLLSALSICKLLVELLQRFK